MPQMNQTDGLQVLIRGKSRLMFIIGCFYTGKNSREEEHRLIFYEQVTETLTWCNDRLPKLCSTNKLEGFLFTLVTCV